MNRSSNTLTASTPMSPRLYTTGLLVLAIASAVTLLPASALAQAGLTGNAMGPSGNSQFDRGFQNKSALGQLEELTGSTVDRSYSSRSTVTRVAPQPRVSQPRYNPNQQIANAFAGAFAQALFSGLVNDDSTQQQAAAEQAAAQAEAFRVHQEAVRVARIQMAQHYRAEWDAREAEIGDRLGGAFDVTTSTSFFGRPANPDADTVAEILAQDVGDASVVDLRGSSLVVQLLRQPTPAATPARSTTRAPVADPWADEWPDDSRPELRRPWHPDWRAKFKDLGFAYAAIGIKSMGGDSIPAFASMSDKLKDSLDLKKNLTEHLTEYLKMLFDIAGQATDPRANDAVLASMAFDKFQAGADNLTDDAKSGIQNSLVLNSRGGLVPENSPGDAAIDVAQSMFSDLQDWWKWGADAPNTP